MKNKQKVRITATNEVIRTIKAGRLHYATAAYRHQEFTAPGSSQTAIAFFDASGKFVAQKQIGPGDRKYWATNYFSAERIAELEKFIK